MNVRLTLNCRQDNVVTLDCNLYNCFVPIVKLPVLDNIKMNIVIMVNMKIGKCVKKMPFRLFSP